jgi:predicted Rossmann fold flavoprotein
MDGGAAMERATVVVVGGGAAGYFGAIRAAEERPHARVILLEATRRPLTKVRISGGGRCNVTHHCFDPATLVQRYPRGAKELRGAFARFQPKDTVAWFAARGVTLKVEDDGRMFPITDDSATISDCLESAAKAAGVDVRLGRMVKSIARHAEGLVLTVRDQGTERLILAKGVLLTTGSMPGGFDLARALGHTLVDPVPSLFTFMVDDARLRDLAGISLGAVDAELRCDGATLKQSGPLLITHWGLSGPAILKLSAFGARHLHAANYEAELRLDLVPHVSAAEVEAALRLERDTYPKRAAAKHQLFELPRRLWAQLVPAAGIGLEQPWGDVTRVQLGALVEGLKRATFAVSGKGEFKEEFVTAGGVALKEVDFRTMASKVCPGLFFAGEILDIDGITGGYNFQNAWTTAWIAGSHVSA